MARGPSFDPRAFAGTHAPPGASPEALRELEKMMQADEEREAAPAPTRKRGRRPPPASAPPHEAEQADDDDDDETPQRAGPQARGRARRVAHSGHGRPAKEDRVQRAVRLTAPLDAKLRQLAEFRGVDLNAAMSVAIVEDWRRCFGSGADRR